jgi:protein gp37
MCDIGEDHADLDEWRWRAFDALASVTNLDVLLLTKRPEVLGAKLKCHFGNTLPPFWVGCTAGTQAMADTRIPQLLKIPASVRFVSCEPLLGPVTFEDERSCQGVTTIHNWLTGDRSERSGLFGGSYWIPDDGYCEPRIHWVIAGGESGPGARPMHPDWVRSIRVQCKEADVPFLFKQWGEWAPEIALTSANTPSTCEFHTRHLFPDNQAVYRVGKKAAGRELDGRIYDKYPEVDAWPKSN